MTKLLEDLERARCASLKKLQWKNLLEFQIFTVCTLHSLEFFRVKSDLVHDKSTSFFCKICCGVFFFHLIVIFELFVSIFGEGNNTTSTSTHCDDLDVTKFGFDSTQIGRINTQMIKDIGILVFEI